MLQIEEEDIKKILKPIFNFYKKLLFYLFYYKFIKCLNIFATGKIIVISFNFFNFNKILHQTK